MEAILFYEQDRKGIHWKKIVAELVEGTIHKAGSLLLNKPSSQIVRYLGRTNRKYAVEVIFKLMKEYPIEADKNEFSSIANAFDKYHLFKEHNKLINQGLDNFLRSEDNRLSNLGLTLRERIT